MGTGAKSDAGGASGAVQEEPAVGFHGRSLVMSGLR